MKPKVCILLSTYNGERYLREQLDSLLAQKDVEPVILVRDDGSTDSTADILGEYALRGALTWYGGENLGVARSFMDLARRAPEHDFYAFCDQDDVWDEDKLSAALERIGDRGEPALYISATQPVDKDLNPISTYRRPFSLTFGESMVLHPATGCTMVFNNRLREAVNVYRPPYLSMHDSWFYRVCTLLDGYVYYDPVPHIKYRQHGNNVIGASSSALKRWKRRYDVLFRKGSGIRSATARCLYEGYGHMASERNATLLRKMTDYDKSLGDRFGLAFCEEFKIKWKKARIVTIAAILLNRY